MAATQLEQLKREFLEHLEIEKGRSLKTVENYERYLARFLDMTKCNKPSDITDEVIRRYRLELNRQSAGKKPGGAHETLKKKTQNCHHPDLHPRHRHASARGA